LLPILVILDMLSIVKVQRWPVLIKILLVLGATNGLLVRVGVVSVMLDACALTLLGV
jgi:hypothetical protein